MVYDCIVVGGGMAGLTAASYLSQTGRQVLLLEKEEKLGGLVNSFEHNGFTFDGGIRALENSGIIFPMLRQLGIDLKMVKNDVSIGIEKDILRLSSKDSLKDYEGLLNRAFPGYENDVRLICAEIARVMVYMDVLYGIDNPLFMDMKSNPRYMMRTVLPWLFKYILTIPKIGKLNMPVGQYLKKFTSNQGLIDMIAQHFFKDTPTFFALSYFSLYLDYRYPLGGTGNLSGKMEEYVLNHGGHITKGAEVVSVDPSTKTLTDRDGNTYGYRKLIWAADMKRLYAITRIDAISDAAAKEEVRKKKEAISDKVGGDSILTMYLESDLDKSYFAKVSSPHFFYTPKKKGLNDIIGGMPLSASDGAAGSFSKDKGSVFDWVRRYLEYTTYEISCPVMRDPSMAPVGKTGLIVSSLMDYRLVRHISDMGWYEEFKEFCGRVMVEVLDSSCYPGLKESLSDIFVSTPLTLERITGNTDGAITGWAFTNNPVPAVSNLPKVAKSVDTPIPDILQAGQWSFSPSGLPISILTGKLAADKAIKQLG